MRTEKQIEASRLNGAKSRGPVTDAGKRISAANSAFSTGPRTPEGKARSSKNATRVEWLANAVALPTESNELFVELLQNFRLALQPVGFMEEHVVEAITACDWYRRRYWAVGMARIAHAIYKQQQSSDALTNQLVDEIEGMHTALAISTLADSGRTLEFFRRCDTGYSREYRNARKELKELQTERFKREQAILDDGGDSTDFEYYAESEPFVIDTLPCKYSDQTEPNAVTAPFNPNRERGENQVNATTEKLPIQTEPNATSLASAQPKPPSATSIVQPDPQPAPAATSLASAQPVPPTAVNAPLIVSAQPKPPSATSIVQPDPQPAPAATSIASAQPDPPAALFDATPTAPYNPKRERGEHQETIANGAPYVPAAPFSPKRERGENQVNALVQPEKLPTQTEPSRPPLGLPQNPPNNALTWWID